MYGLGGGSPGCKCLRGLQIPLKYVASCKRGKGKKRHGGQMKKLRTTTQREITWGQLGERRFLANKGGGGNGPLVLAKLIQQQ